jgi:ADP-L-glycero-D-manno-heptose 6-epimerase
LQDEQYFKENNLQYSCHMAEWATKIKARFIYASSAATYGELTNNYRDDEKTIRACKPLNLYGQSKQKFDEWILDHGLQTKVVGLKFFNVFGPNEYHKGDMRSVVAKSYDRAAKEGKIALFKSYSDDYADGEQQRDFIYVKDVVDIVLFFVEHERINGIFNVGTGLARTWNDLANALFTAVGKSPNIEYVPMPEVLRGKYQYFTQADMSKLRSIGYDKPFTDLEIAVKDYVGYLKQHLYW